MWTNDVSRLGASAMDKRACPSYEAGFDACDPLGSVLEWTGRGPARVLRRRCRSEGIDRSPYEDAPLHRSADGPPRPHRALPNKSHFTINTLGAQIDKLRYESSFAAENGDYIMHHDRRHHYPSRTAANRNSPPNPVMATLTTNVKVEERLPKVEELFERFDHDMMEVPIAKQPLKSILNNPLPINIPPGILKKPKIKSTVQNTRELSKSPERRRRQRASSESDNLFSTFHLNTTYESRLLHVAHNGMKRVKDNSGVGYSYGCALATLSNIKAQSPPPKGTKSNNKDPPAPPVVSPKDEDRNLQVLRTTAIVSEFVELPPVKLPSTIDTTGSGTACPALSAAAAAAPAPPAAPAPVPIPPINTVITPTSPKKGAKLAKKKVKPKFKTSPIPTKIKTTKNDKPVLEAETKPESDDNFGMDTDSLTDLEKFSESWNMIMDGRTNTSSSPMNLVTVEAMIAPIAPPEPEVKAEKKEDLDAANKLPQKINNKPTPVQKVLPSKGSPINLPESLAGCLRPSLFPRVPPYIKFVGHDEMHMQKLPMPIQKHLKWKLTSITPIVVKKTLVNSGFKLVKSECDTAECPQEETVEWVGIWGKHMKSLLFRAIKDGQKLNHFPGTFQIGRKDRLWRNLQKLVNKHGIKEFGIMPKTYVLPHDLKLLKHDWEKHVENNEKWIIKPPASARGTGIKVVSRWTQIPKKRSVVVQRYVSKPYLINGSKFDLRLYVLVTSMHPLRIYLYKDGLARFASVKYNDEVASLNDRYMHLTNYSINRLSKNYTPNEDYTACEGHKWTLQSLMQYLRTEKNVDTVALWESLRDLVIKTMISGEASISSLTKANVTSRYNCYELFGIDVLLDEYLKPWLLEVNISPSLHSASPLDIHVKGPMVTTVLNIAQFQVPNKVNLDSLTKEKPHKLNSLPYDTRLYTIYLSKEERDKHIIYTNMDDREVYLRDILSTLTPDDVRHLIQAEDELTQAGDMERVFPTRDTYKYLNYLAGPRYYNRLFDAWESRYSMKRDAGVELLRNLCDIGYHLDVPPVPLKNDVDAPSPAASERPSGISLTALEQQPSAIAAKSVHAAGRTCGDCLPAPVAALPLEPRA